MKTVPTAALFGYGLFCWNVWVKKHPAKLQNRVTSGTMNNMKPTISQIESHTELLKERVFQVDSKWPHFKLLFDDIPVLTSDLKPDATVVTMERGVLYGGYSLIGPLFSRFNFIGVDCSPQSAEERGAYNSPMVDDERFLAVKTHCRTSIYDTTLGENMADLLLIPNLVHHVQDQAAMFAEAARILKPGATLYIFEPLVREIHQAPDDFIRYTPYGLSDALEKSGFTVTRREETGGPFSAIAYCWAQALEYFPDDKRAEMSEWFYQKHMPELMSWDQEHRHNQCREHTRFPMAFSVTAELNS